MAENYSLNSKFGLNVSVNNANLNTGKQAAKNIDEAVGSLFDNITNYVAKYENVFDGTVEKEINMYSRQAMIVGMNLKAADNTKSDFDMNI